MKSKRKEIIYKDITLEEFTTLCKEIAFKEFKENKKRFIIYPEI